MTVAINTKKTYIFRMYLKVESTELGDGLGDSGVNEKERSGIFPHFWLEQLSDRQYSLLR